MPVYAASRKRKRRFLFPVLITAVFALVILSAVWLTKTIVTSQLQENSAAAPPAYPADNPTITASAPPVEKVTFTEHSMLNMTYLYSCGHTASKVEKIPPEFIGKTLDEVKETFPEYHITSFSPGTSVAEKKLTSVCDEH